MSEKNFTVFKKALENKPGGLNIEELHEWIRKSSDEDCQKYAQMNKNKVSTEILIDIYVTEGFIEKRDELYKLTPFSEKISALRAESEQLNSERELRVEERWIELEVEKSRT